MKPTRILWSVMAGMVAEMPERHRAPDLRRSGDNTSLMAGEALIFRDVAYVLVAAVLGGAVAWAARQPLILGYVLGGILISPFTPGPAVSDIHTFEVLAEVGLVL